MREPRREHEEHHEPAALGGSHGDAPYSPSDALDLLFRDALRGIPGVDAAFIFGSTVAGTAGPDSDVDLFVIESPSLDRRELNKRLFHLRLVLERQVNALRYSPQALGERIGDPEHAAYRFTRQVLAGPKRWVAGSPDAIRPLASAAGVPLAGLSIGTA